MKTLLRIVISGLALAAGAAQAQQAPLTAADIAKIKTEAAAVVTAYVDAFNRKDAKAIADTILSNPSVAIGANGVALQPHEQAVGRYTEMVASFERTGWAKSEISGSTVCVLNASVAFVDTRITRFKADGAVLSQATTLYVLNKARDGKWRIATFTGHDPAKTVSCGD